MLLLIAHIFIDNQSVDTTISINVAHFLLAIFATFLRTVARFLHTLFVLSRFGYGIMKRYQYYHLTSP